MTTTTAKTLAETHRAALVEIGWQCGEVQAFGDEAGFEVLRGAGGGPQRRTFSTSGTMTIVRHGNR